MVVVADGGSRMTARTKRRRPLLAALLSLLIPGLGQLYAGRAIRALLFLTVTAFMTAVGGYRLLPLDDVFLFHRGVELLVGLVIAVVAFRIFAIVDAILVARRAGMAVLRAFQHWYVYVGVCIAFVAPEFAFDRDSLRPIANYSIPSASMVPTLMPGDYVLGPNHWFGRHQPERGGIAVYVPPDGQTTYVNRIIGLPGDRVQLRDGRLYLNGQAVPRERLDGVAIPNAPDVVVYRETLPTGEIYLVAERGDDNPLDNTDLVVVPPGQVFLLGDNRDGVRDSRIIGTVELERLDSRPVMVFWSRDLGRIGLKLQ
jgi:signal peptidase I